MPPALSSLEIEVTVIGGRNLVAKDRNMIGMKKKSDPYVEFYFGGKFRGKTEVQKKTLSPTWDHKFNLEMNANDTSRILRNLPDSSFLCFRIYDEDDLTEDDFMGVVNIKIPYSGPATTKWYPVECGDGKPYCKDGTDHGKLTCKSAKGDLQIEVAVSARKCLDLVRGNRHLVECPQVQIAFCWEFTDQNKGTVDVETACVAMGKSGAILMEESVYYGDDVNSNGTVRYSSDVRHRHGDKNERIYCDLGAVPKTVGAFYFVMTVSTARKTVRDIRSGSAIVSNVNGFTVAQFEPKLTSEGTSMFMFRLSKPDPQAYHWEMSIIDETYDNARDFGSLIPEIKGYCRDTIPSVVLNTKERIAIMKKGRAIRMKDYCLDGKIPSWVGLRFQWDITRGHTINLDASCICLNSSLDLVDVVSSNQLRSNDDAIIHSGETEEVGKKITINLSTLNPDVTHIGFAINSYSEQELNDLLTTKCSLFNQKTNKILAICTMNKTEDLNGYTALLLACIYRESETEWNLRFVGEAAQGHQTSDLVDEFQNFLRRVPPPSPMIPPNPDSVNSEMPPQTPIDTEGALIVGSFK